MAVLFLCGWNLLILSVFIGFVHSTSSVYLLICFDRNKRLYILSRGEGSRDKDCLINAPDGGFILKDGSEKSGEGVHVGTLVL